MSSAKPPGFGCIYSIKRQKFEGINKLPAIMKNSIYILILTIFVCAGINAQNSITITVKPIRPEKEIVPCEDKVDVYGGRVRRFEVIEKSDQEVFGKFLYAIESCREFIEWPSFNKKYNLLDLYGGKSFKLVLDLKRPRYLQGCLITDESLLELNVHKQDFYIVDLYEIFLSGGELRIRR